MPILDGQTRFRLLDGYVGWDENLDLTKNVIGLDDQIGLRLEDLETSEVPEDILLLFMPPAWIARGCRPFEWYLCGPSEPVIQSRPQLLRYDSCRGEWLDLLPGLRESSSLRRPVAVHVWKRFLIVGDEGNNGSCGQVLIWSIPEGRLIGFVELFPGDRPLAVVYAWGEVIVSVGNSDPNRNRRLLRFDPSGDARGEIEIPSPASGQARSLNRLLKGNDGALWIAEGEPGETSLLWRVTLAACGTVHHRHATASCSYRQEFCVQEVNDSAFGRSPGEKLKKIFEPTGLISIRGNQFCLKLPMVAGVGDSMCFGRDGSSQPLPDQARAVQPRKSTGTLVTKALDSFIPRCRWHRIRVEADVPRDSSFSIAVATSETEKSPHPLDWQTFPENTTDLLIQQPPGRYLHVKIALASTQTISPTIRRLRIDFPRLTSLEQLPVVYREDPLAEDFTERFLSLFDAATEDLDRAIERFPALLDPTGVPDEVLPWLGMFLGIAFDPSWRADRRRRLLIAAPALFRQRGTMAGLRVAIELIFDASPVIEERIHQRAWGALGSRSHLGAVRLFGKSRARFLIGSSALNAAPLRSYGNPDHDPLRSEAHRFSVLMPPGPVLTTLGIAQLDRLIAHQKPAHTLHTLRVGGNGFVLGQTSIVGIDSKLVANDPPVLGSENRKPGIPGNVRLNRTSILRHGPHGPALGLGIGKALVGINTLLE
ncbi:MAG TPA: phage tail protein [Planctomycetaceae bacterium]|nr:phage tail protein [Planctomycetaceae bacterium]